MPIAIDILVDQMTDLIQLAFGMSDEQRFNQLTEQFRSMVGH